MIVVDSSVLFGVFFGEETARGAIAELNAVQGDGLVAPDFLVLELANAMMSNRRRVQRAVPAAGNSTAGDWLGSLPTSRLAEEIRRRLALVDLVLEPAITETRFTRAIQIAELHRLSMYDACYIALAEELRARLATLDGPMRDAALSLGIRVVPSRAGGGSDRAVN